MASTTESTLPSLPADAVQFGVGVDQSDDSKTLRRYPDNDPDGAMANPVPDDEAAAIENIRRIGEAKDLIDEDVANIKSPFVGVGGTIPCPACGNTLFYKYRKSPIWTEGKCTKAGCLTWRDSGDSAPVLRDRKARKR